MPTSIDYFSSGIGKFVLAILPNPDIERTRVLAKTFTEMLGAPVGHVSGFVEFFWDSGLDQDKINKTLNQFTQDNPDLTVRFQTHSGFPPMGL